MFHGTVSLEIANGLKELRKRIARKPVPPSQLDKTLNLATWNIRKFGNKRRTQAAIHYIAEIVGQFDIVSVVELHHNLGDLQRVLKILGPYWRVVYSDMIPDKGGNEERLAFVYDERAATFTGFASMVALPGEKVGTEYTRSIPWWRAPYAASFSAGNFDFVVVTCHIQWGTAAGRQNELKKFADWIQIKAAQKYLEDKDILVTGDFNLSSRTMLQTLLSSGLQVPSALRKAQYGTNLAQNKRYDQILHLCRYPDSFMNEGGTIDFFTGGTEALFPGISKEAFTHQLSDHLPLWVQIDTDNDAFQLDQIIKAKKSHT
jgi:endonuclease/exonuclease/phosphatase family metal-dependent hydrolase